MSGTNSKRATRRSSSRGISLIEVLIAIAVFTLAIATLGTMSYSGSLAMTDAIGRLRANLAADEAVAALRSIRKLDPSRIVPGTYGLGFSGGEWSLLPDPIADDGLLRAVTIAIMGPGKYRADIAVSWTAGSSRAASTTRVGTLHFYEGSRWTQTAAAEFSQGKRHGTEVRPTGDGAVGLELRNDWARPREFASVDISGTGITTALTEASGMLYAASWGTAGTVIESIDIADAGNNIVTSVRSVTRPERVHAIVASGRHLFLATDGDASELVVLRRSDLSLARVVDLSGSSDLLSLVASGTALYAGRANSTNPELYEFSIADPESGVPQLRSTNFPSSVAALEIAPRYLFAGRTAVSGEVVAIRRSDLTAVRTANFPGNAAITSLALDGSDLYVGRLNSSANELSRIDASDPSVSFSATAGVDVPGGILALSVGADHRIYGAGNRANGELIVAEPGTLATRSVDVASGAGGSAIRATGGYVYIGLANTNPEVVGLRGGIGQWENPRIAGAYDASGSSDGLSAAALSGTLIALGTGASGGPELFLVDTTAPATPALLGSLEAGGGVTAIAAATPNLIVIASGNNSAELRTVSVANPAAPVSLGVYNTPGNPDALAVAASGTLIALGTDNNTGSTGRELYLFSVANPASPVLVANKELGTAVRDLAFTPSGHLVAATDNDAKEVIVFDPRQAGVPEVASYNTPGAANARGTQAAGSMVVVVTEDAGATPDLFVFSLNPGTGALALQGSLDLGASGNSLTLGGTLAFVAAGGAPELIIADIANPSSPRIVSRLPFPAEPTDIAGDATRVFASDRGNPTELIVVEPNPPQTELVARGYFTSSIFDSGSAGTLWSGVGWTNSGGGRVAIQVRTSATASGLPDALWVGVGGEVDGAIGVSESPISTDPLADGTRYIQYRAILSTEGGTEPVLEDVTLRYQ